MPTEAEATSNPIPGLRHIAQLSREELKRADLINLAFMPTEELVALGEMAARQDPPNSDILSAVGAVSLIRRLSGQANEGSLDSTIMTAFPAYYEV